MAVNAVHDAQHGVLYLRSAVDGVVVVLLEHEVVLQFGDRDGS
jgi:hypothetical protein